MNDQGKEVVFGIPNKRVASKHDKNAMHLKLKSNKRVGSVK